MPIKVQSALPAREILDHENIFVMDEFRAMEQDIRPLQICILNLMPVKTDTELHLLRSLSNTENGYLFWQVRRGKQRIASLVCGDRLTEIRVAVGLKLSAFFVAVINVTAPRDHIVRIVVEQFHLRCKLGDIVSGTCSCFQWLIPATAKAIQARLGRCSRCVGYLVALVEYQLYFLVMYPHPPLDLLLILSHSVERDDYKVASLDTGKVGQLLHEYVG